MQATYEDARSGATGIRAKEGLSTRSNRDRCEQGGGAFISEFSLSVVSTFSFLLFVDEMDEMMADPILAAACAAAWQGEWRSVRESG